MYFYDDYHNYLKIFLDSVCSSYLLRIPRIDIFDISKTECISSFINVWCTIKGHAYFDKPAAISCGFFLSMYDLLVDIRRERVSIKAENYDVTHKHNQEC